MMLAARGAIRASGAKTARDYVQDGLIAMWDGIENAGWGTHDPNATPINLVSGESDFPFASFTDKQITDNSIVITGDSTYQSSASYTIPGEAPYVTLEANVGMERDDASSSTLNLWIALGSTGTSSSLNLYQQSSKLVFARGNNYFNFTESATSGSMNSAVYSAVASVDKSNDSSYNVGDYYKNGLLAYSTNKTDWVFSSYYITNPAKLLIRVRAGTKLVLRNLRFYSRALTADEISRNYAIDKERFNLL